MSEFRFLLTGGISTQEAPPNPVTWLADKQWGEMVRLSGFESFKGLSDSFCEEQVR